MNFNYSRLMASLGLGAMFICGASPTLAATAPDLGTAETFVVLGGSTVTNTGSTVLNGDLGVWPGLAITGFPPGTVNGTTHAGDAVALQAQSDLVTAYDDLAGQACDTDLSGQDLGGLTLLPGVYCFSTSAQLTGTLTLDAEGDPNAVFVFQIGSTLTTATNSVVAVINGGSECNAFWQVGSSATLGTGTTFAGSILALTSITMNTSAGGSGQLLARDGAVTLDTVDASLCVPACPAITVDPSVLPTGELGVPYSQAITASGGSAPYSFAVTAGMLQPDLSLDPSSGLLSGTPLSTGTWVFTITATDANGCQVSKAYTILVNPAPCPPILVTPPTLPDPVPGSFYSQVISATGGTGLYSFTVTAGMLPPGLDISPLTLTPEIVLSGTPTAFGDFSFAITATDENGCPGIEEYTFTVTSVTAIPTLSGWAMILLAALLAWVGIAVVRRRPVM